MKSRLLSVFLLLPTVHANTPFEARAATYLVHAGRACALCEKLFEDKLLVTGCPQHRFHPGCYDCRWPKCWGCMNIIEKTRFRMAHCLRLTLNPTTVAARKVDEARRWLEGYFK